MSRQIDVSNPEALSEEDQAYLRARGRVDIVAELNRVAAVKAAEAIPRRNRELAEQTASQRRRSLKPEDIAKQSAPKPEEEEVPPYDQWSRDELIAELKVRKLSTVGKNDELVERLEENDRT
jgi:SAP domain-containing protein